jgi:hypothetical protein
MTEMEKMFAEVHAEVAPVLDAMQVADAVSISPLARGSMTVGESSKNSPTLGSRYFKRRKKRVALRHRCPMCGCLLGEGRVCPRCKEAV